MKFPVMYTQAQMEQIQKFIHETFGGDENSVIAHEITSEYVHTDTAVIADDGKERVFVTFGMGAREMNAPHPELAHTELVLSASASFDPQSKEAMTLIAELVALSKFPFREDTWLGHGHTINASDAFQETFGFEALTFCHTGEFAQVEGIGKVGFLAVVPIYAEEREWFMQTNSAECIDDLYDYLGEEMFLADTRRDPGLPVEWILMEELKALDRQKQEQFREFLEAATEQGEEITYEMIEVWMRENS